LIKRKTDNPGARFTINSDIAYHGLQVAGAVKTPAYHHQGDVHGKNSSHRLSIREPDDDAARKRIIAAGGKEKNTLALGSGAHYEVKFEGPEGIVVDIGHWAGAAPVNETAPQPEAATSAVA
jgi:hypothetical protein